MLGVLATLSVVVMADVINSSTTTYNESLQVLSEPFPYQFPNETVDAIDLFPVPLCNGVPLEEATIDSLQSAMQQNRLSSVQLTTCYLQRYFQTRDYINAVMELNPDMFDIAQAMDDERAKGRVRGPLHGIPIIVKDNIATKDKMETTAGSWALLGSIVPRDAFVVSKLRSAGAVLFGKAGLSEWADMRSNNYSEGYSARGGQVRSAYNLTLNPGGSSSGSGAAVGANAIMIALGTETDGSVISPAERNAIVGIKPTVGLTSRNGVVPESEHQDTVGTFARTVRDAVYTLDAIYGIDVRDNYTSAQLNHTPSHGYTQSVCTSSSLNGTKLGIPWLSFWQYASADMQSQLLTLLSDIESAGATIVNNTELPSRSISISPNGWDWNYGNTRGFPNESEYTYVAVDFYNNIATYLSELNNTKVKSIDDIIAFNNANDGTEGGYAYPLGIPAFYSGQDGFVASQATLGIQSEEYFQALEFCHRTTRGEGIDAALYNHGDQLDALLVPSDVGQTDQIAAQAGYPMITIPAGVSLDTAMPFGLGIMGSAWSEGKLIEVASAIENLQIKIGMGRTLPTWAGYMERNIPVLNL